jgi:2-polyprenyl-3-methyl-5-hydroxy-6-metoxy-1,4-benzoquinol methylase
MADELDEVVQYYERTEEEHRLAAGIDQLELLRTQEILSRYLPAAPAKVIDVGGATGVHARWLADAGYDVHIVDLTPGHIVKAHAELASVGVTAEVGDARRLSAQSETYDVALVLGPMYHLPSRADRLTALEEARRVVRPGGLIAVAAISRFASLFDGLAREFLFQAEFQHMVARDLAEGRHENPERRPGWFTTAYFHLPAELRDEALEAGLHIADVFGVEGLAGWMAHLAPRWAEDDDRRTILEAARAIETEPSLSGLSAHLLLIAHAPPSLRP